MVFSSCPDPWKGPFLMFRGGTIKTTGRWNIQKTMQTANIFTAFQDIYMSERSLSPEAFFSLIQWSMRVCMAYEIPRGTFVCPPRWGDGCRKTSPFLSLEWKLQEKTHRKWMDHELTEKKYNCRQRFSSEWNPAKPLLILHICWLENHTSSPLSHCCQSERFHLQERQSEAPTVWTKNSSSYTWTHSR